MTSDPGQQFTRDPAQRRAGMVTRFGAAAADLGVVLLLGAVIYLSISGAKFIWSPTRFSWPEPPLLISFAVEGVLAIGYLTAGWAISGRTFGKSLLGLRVVSMRGRLLGWTRSFLRAVFCVFFPVGLFWVLFSPSRRSVQDIALRTMVIYDWTKTQQAG